MRERPVYFSMIWLLPLLLGSAGMLNAAGPLLSEYTFKSEEKSEHRIISLKQINTPPHVDGVLDESFWSEALICDRFLSGKIASPAAGTILKMACDGNSLYLGAICPVADVRTLKRVVTPGGPGSNSVAIWRDDCIDFKLSPDGGRSIYQFLVNPNGAFYEVFNGDAAWKSNSRIAAAVTDSAYIVEAAIPLASLGIKSAGGSLLFNFGRADRSGSAEELLTISGPYGDLRAAPLLLCGPSAEGGPSPATGAMRRVTDAELILDREEYPAFQPLATGRLRLHAARDAEPFKASPGIKFSLLKNGREVRSQFIGKVLSDIVDFDMDLKALGNGEHQLMVEVFDGDERLTVRKETLRIVPRHVARQGRIPLTLPAVAGQSGRWPLTFGVPFPWGALDDADNVKLLDGRGKEVPIQVKVTSRWSKKGSIRWLLIDCQAPVGGKPSGYTLVYGPQVRRAPVREALRIDRRNDRISIDNGSLSLDFPLRMTPGLGEARISAAGKPGRVLMTAGQDAGPYMVDEAGTRYWAVLDDSAEVALEENGPLKAVVRVSGWHVAAGGGRLGRFILRYHIYRGLPFVRVAHTFIITEDASMRYRDIGYALPWRSNRYALGTPNVIAGSVGGSYGSTWLLQADDLHFKVYQNGALKESGERAEGWLTAGLPGRMMTLAVKDFWQNSPKELEVTPEGVTMHFWPLHGESSAEDINIRNAYRLQFAHQGELLDFKVPERVLEYLKVDSEQYNYPHAKVANPMGLAKTHEMMLYFHEGGWEDAGSRSLNLILQSMPTAVCDPAWVTSSGVFGRMHPRDTAAFPAEERALDESFAQVPRLQALGRDYGIFNFGDSHHNWNWEERRWSLHRIWRNTHHGWTRWPWLLYARSGDKDIFDWGYRNAAHVADVDHCHYAAPEYVGLPYPRGKLPGGIADYKGLVHWASGDRLCYNSAADAMLWHYYFTGSERSLDTALLHGAALLADGHATVGREGSGRFTSACELYYQTWDNGYLEFLERTKKALLATQRADGGFNHDWINFAPFLQRYIDLRQSREARQAMRKWADWTCESEPDKRAYQAKLNILAYAAMIACEEGDRSAAERYLGVAAARAARCTENLYQGEDPRYKGEFIPFPGSLTNSYYMQEVPYYLEALALTGIKPQPIPWRTTQMRAWAREDIAGAGRYVFRARLRRTTAAALDLSISLLSNGKALIGELYAVGADGKEGGKLLTAAADNGLIRMSLPASGVQEFLLVIHAERDFFIDLPITAGQPGVQEVYPIQTGGNWIGDGHRYYFDLPVGTDKFSVKYRGRIWPAKLQIFDPGGRLKTEDIWIGANDTGFRHLQVDSAGAGAQGWSLAAMANGQINILDIQCAPAGKGHDWYFAAAADKLFQPR